MEFIEFLWWLNGDLMVTWWDLLGDTELPGELHVKSQLSVHVLRLVSKLNAVHEDWGQNKFGCSQVDGICANYFISYLVYLVSDHRYAHLAPRLVTCGLENSTSPR